MVCKVATIKQNLDAARQLEEMLAQLHISPDFKQQVEANHAHKRARRPLWQPNRANCSLCGRNYEFFASLFQHHCRQCGRSMCDDCCAWKEIPEFDYSDQKVRACIVCEDEPVKLAPEQLAEDAAIEAEMARVRTAVAQFRQWREQGSLPAIPDTALMRTKEQLATAAADAPPPAYSLPPFEQRATEAEVASPPCSSYPALPSAPPLDSL
jgi:hypothetical protein